MNSESNPFVEYDGVTSPDVWSAEVPSEVSSPSLSLYPLSSQLVPEVKRFIDNIFRLWELLK
jgi:hypothetical protein